MYLARQLLKFNSSRFPLNFEMASLIFFGGSCLLSPANVTFRTHPYASSASAFKPSSVDAEPVSQHIKKKQSHCFHPRCAASLSLSEWQNSLSVTPPPKQFSVPRGGKKQKQNLFYEISRAVKQHNKYRYRNDVSVGVFNFVSVLVGFFFFFCPFPLGWMGISWSLC